MDIRDMPLSQGTKNAVRRAGIWGYGPLIETSEDLFALTDDDLLSIRKIGKTRLLEIRAALANLPEPDRSWLIGA